MRGGCLVDTIVVLDAKSLSLPLDTRWITSTATNREVRDGYCVSEKPGKEKMRERGEVVGKDRRRGEWQGRRGKFESGAREDSSPGDLLPSTKNEPALRQKHAAFQRRKKP